MITNFEFRNLNAPKYNGIILNKNEYQEIYKEAFAKAKEKFGENSLAYKTIINGIDKENVTGSQFFWNTWLEQSEISLPGKIMLLSDWENALSSNPGQVSGFYTNMSQLILRSDKATWKNNQPIINDLSKKLKGEFEYSSENPLLITGAKLIPSKNKDNHYGIDLDIENAEIKNDERFAYGKKEIQLGNIPKPLWTKKDGLSGLYLDEYGLSSNVVNLMYSDSYGRVAVLNAGGVLLEEMKNYLNKLEGEKRAQIKKIENRYFEARNILKGK